MRLIDADALIPKINECVNGHYITDFDAIATILDAPTIEPKRGEWVPCSERLPSESEQDNELGVLVTLGNGYSGIQFDWVRDGEHWYDWDGYVIAWMPLPKPYGEREGE